MHMKECPRCEKKSYSTNKNNWRCPICGADLTDVEAKIASVDKNE